MFDNVDIFCNSNNHSTTELGYAAKCVAVSHLMAVRVVVPQRRSYDPVSHSVGCTHSCLGLVEPVEGLQSSPQLCGHHVLLLVHLQDALVLNHPPGQVGQDLLHGPERHVLVHRVTRLACTRKHLVRQHVVACMTHAHAHIYVHTAHTHTHRHT